MAHLFVIGGITPENEGRVMLWMMQIKGMQRIHIRDDGISVFLSDSSEDHTKIAIQVQLAIGGTGSAIIAGGL